MQHWVVLETGSNQAFIFETNKQRLQVAASRLVRELGYDWVPEALSQACAEFPGQHPNHVVKASGKAAILASPEIGRRVIDIVTRRAALEGAGIDVWGVVGTHPVAGDLSDAGVRLDEANQALDAHRHARPSPLWRGLNNPFTEQCQFTSRPAAPPASQAMGESQPDKPASEAVQRLWEKSFSARRELVNLLQTAGGPEADDKLLGRSILSEQNLDVGVTDNGWVGVLHADGNGIGNIFTNLRHIYRGTEFVEKQKELSVLLEELTWQALANATTQVAEGNESWLLPIVVGGDDITAVLDGKLAFEFAVTLVGEFEQLVADRTVFADALTKVRAMGRDAPDKVTMAAGLVFIKPHHPFSHAAELAEELTKSAKRHGKPHSAIDIHVLFESAVRDIEALRGEATIASNGADQREFRQFGGPFLDDDSSPHSLARLQALMTVLDPPDAAPGIAMSAIRRLQTALTATDTADQAVFHARVDRARRQLLATAPSDGSPAIAAVENALRCSDDDGEFTMVASALDLIDVRRGTVAKQQ